MGLDVEAFVAACRGALHEADPRAAVEEEVRRLLADPAATAAVRRERTTYEALHQEAGLTVLHLVLPPGVRSVPHDHAMWAVVGVAGGREDNAFFQRAAGGLAPAGGRTVEAGGVLALADDAIHAIENPTAGYTAAIHVYGGDLFRTPRRAWGPAGEGPMDEAVNRRIAAAAAAREDELGRPLSRDDVAALVAAAP